MKLLIPGPSIFLNSGESYLIVVGSLGDNGNTNDLVVGNSGSSVNQTSFFYNMTNQTWYYSNSTPMVRLDFTPTVSLNNEFTQKSFHTYPNPTSSYINVEHKLKCDVVKIVITDFNGKILLKKISHLNNTSNPIQIDVSDLPEAIYKIHLFTNDFSFVDLFIVK